ncbi:MAG: hypothetical protein K1X51_18150 [Rhodospirillaceae bacterium]|nr:hypothetical protein [Rhodospirillaceae bacterium]
MPVLVVVAGAASAYPLAGSFKTVADSLASSYTYGAEVPGEGVGYTHYAPLNPDGSYGAVRQLAITDNLATIKALTAGGAALLGVDLQGVTHQYNGNGNDLVAHQVAFGWNYGYTLQFNGREVVVDVQVDFDWHLVEQADPTFNAARQLQKEQAWERDIEDWWSRRYPISKDNGLYYFDVVFDLTLSGYREGGGRRFDQTVLVKPGSGRANMTTWFLNSDDQTAAHEFGHMLGMYDEYLGGALNPADLVARDWTLMGADPGTLFSGGGMRPEYYMPFLAWIDSIDDDATQTYALVVSEPGTAVLLLLAIMLWRTIRARDRVVPHRIGVRAVPI